MLEDKKLLIEITDGPIEKNFILSGIDLTKYLLSYEWKSNPDSKEITLKLSVANDEVRFLVKEGWNDER